MTQPMRRCANPPPVGAELASARIAGSGRRVETTRTTIKTWATVRYPLYGGLAMRSEPAVQRGRAARFRRLRAGTGARPYRETLRFDGECPVACWCTETANDGLRDRRLGRELRRPSTEVGTDRS